MKKLLYACMVTLVLSFLLYAANILVWVYDPEGADKWQDPDVGRQINCGYWLEETIKYHGYSPDYHYGLKMPADISSYDLVVATAGFFYC